MNINPQKTRPWFAVPLLFLFFFFAAGASATEKIRVVTTTGDIASLAMEIGGDQVAVESLVRGDQYIHFLEAQSSHIIQVKRADLLIYQGLGLEKGWLPFLIQGGLNRKILPGKAGNLDLSNAIEPGEFREGESDRPKGNLHPRGNPHYHLSPANGLLMAGLIADRLTQLDLENEAVYRNNLENFVRRLKAKIEDWTARLGRFKNPKVVTYHSMWDYFLFHFGIEQVGTLENLPGVPPTDRHLSQLENTMKARNVGIIIRANYVDRKFPDLLAGKTQSQVVVLPASVGGTPEAADYIALLETLVSGLESALSARENSANGLQQD